MDAAAGHHAHAVQEILRDRITVAEAVQQRLDVVPGQAQRIVELRIVGGDLEADDLRPEPVDDRARQLLLADRDPSGNGL